MAIIPGTVRESFSKIADKLQVDQKTIRRRIENLERQKVLEGREVVVNPYFIGHEPIRIILNVPSNEKTKETLVSQLAHVDGIILILDWQGPIVHLLVFCEDDAAISRKIQFISSICGCDDPIILRNSEALGFYKCKSESQYKGSNDIAINQKKSSQKNTTNCTGDSSFESNCRAEDRRSYIRPCFLPYGEDGFRKSGWPYLQYLCFLYQSGTEAFVRFQNRAPGYKDWFFQQQGEPRFLNLPLFAKTLPRQKTYGIGYGHWMELKR